MRHHHTIGDSIITAEQLIEWRKSTKLSQAAAARILGVSRSTYVRWERVGAGKLVEWATIGITLERASGAVVDAAREMQHAIRTHQGQGPAQE